MKKWTDNERQKSIDLLNQGCTYNQISNELKKTVKSVRVKMNRLGYYTQKNDSRIEKKCAQCEINYYSLPSEKRKFCSQSCSAIYNNKLRVNENSQDSIKKVEKPLNKCLSCKINLAKYKNKFCSQDCFIKFKQNQIFETILSGDLHQSQRQYKKYLIKLYGEKCMECGWCEINKYTNKIPIEIEHIDGNSTNNDLSNLKLLCPNCHSLTPTYKGANKGNGRFKRKERYKNGKSF